MPLRKYALPAIPGLNKPHEANEAWHLDFGPNWRDGNSKHPAAEGWQGLSGAGAASRCRRQRTRRRALAGNTVPLATYYRLESARSFDRRARPARLLRGFLPAFPKTAAERQKTGDPRKSIAERYSNRNDYMSKYSRALDKLVKARWILQEDRSAFLQRAEQEWQEATKQNDVPIAK